MMHSPEPRAAWWFSCFQLSSPCFTTLWSWTTIQNTHYKTVKDASKIVKLFSVLEILFRIEDTTLKFERASSPFMVLQFRFPFLCCCHPLSSISSTVKLSDFISPSTFHHTVSLHSIVSLFWAELTVMTAPAVTAVSQIGSVWLEPNFSPPRPLTGNGILHTF